VFNLRKHVRSVVAIIVLMIVVAWIWVGCSDSSPTSPGKPKDYTIYFCEYDEEYTQAFKCYGYHTTNQTIDTIPLPVYPVAGMAVSAEGTLLYVTQSQSVAIVDLFTLEVIKELPYADVREIAVSENDSLIAFLGDELNILKTSDYSLFFHDSVKVFHGIFSKDSKSFYCCYVYDSPYLAYKVELYDSIKVTTKEFSSGGNLMYVGGIIPDEEESKWFLYLQFGTYDFFFSVYDIIQDEFIFSEYVRPGRGQLAVTKNDQYLFYTNSGGKIGAYDPPCSLTVFDINRNEIAKRINTTLYIDSAGIIDTVYFPTDVIAITPDDKWLLGISKYGCDEIIIINVETLEIEKILRLGGYHCLDLPTCQLKR